MLTRFRRTPSCHADPVTADPIRTLATVRSVAARRAELRPTTPAELAARLIPGGSQTAQRLRARVESRRYGGVVRATLREPVELPETKSHAHASGHHHDGVYIRCRDCRDDNTIGDEH
jgi:hypothetical protein